MGRVYAGMLGSLAFATVLLRGTLQGGAAQATLATAVAVLIVFAAIGWLAGHLAGWIVEQSVRSQLAAVESSPSSGKGASSS